MFSFARNLFVAFTLLWPVVQADNPAASTFYFNTTGTTFSINLPTNSSDVFLSISSPARSWVGIGAGATMAGSLMFIMYSSANGAAVTLSPRIGTGHTEPAFAPEIDLELLDGSAVVGDNFVVYAVCHNCRSWSGGSLNLQTTAQPWIYAFGPAVTIMSDSPSAGLRRHSGFGHFTMDMIKATGPGGLPNITGVSASNGAVIDGSPTKDGDKASIIHGVFMAFVFLVLYPFNAVITELFKLRRFGNVLFVILLLILIPSFALGVYVSTEYIRSKKFNSPHQILGFIIVGGFTIDIGVGIFATWRHRRDKEMGVVSYRDNLESVVIWTQRLLVVLALIDGGLGLAFASSSLAAKVAYAVVAAGVAVVMTPFYCCIWRKHKKSQKHYSQDEEPIELAQERHFMNG